MRWLIVGLMAYNATVGLINLGICRQRLRVLGAVFPPTGYGTAEQHDAYMTTLDEFANERLGDIAHLRSWWLPAVAGALWRGRRGRAEAYWRHRLRMRAAFPAEFTHS